MADFEYFRAKVRGSDLERFLEQYPALNPEEAKEGEMEGE